MTASMGFWRDDGTSGRVTPSPRGGRDAPGAGTAARTGPFKESQGNAQMLDDLTRTADAATAILDDLRALIAEGLVGVHQDVDTTAPRFYVTTHGRAVLERREDGEAFT